MIGCHHLGMVVKDYQVEKKVMLLWQTEDSVTCLRSNGLRRKSWITLKILSKPLTLQLKTLMEAM